MLKIDVYEPRKIKELLVDIAEEDILARGDYFFLTPDDLSVCIERKTIGDLLSTIADGRFYGQLEKITQFDIPVLLVEGIYSCKQDGFIALHEGMPSRWRYEAVENMILSAQMHGIILARTPSLWASSQLIRGYFKYLGQGKPDHRFDIKKQRHFSYDGKVSPQLRLVCALPNIGAELGQRLLKEFKNPIGVFVAHSDELQEVEGIGEKTAEGIIKTLWEAQEKEHE